VKTENEVGNKKINSKKGENEGWGEETRAEKGDIWAVSLARVTLRPDQT
jgi:hypothetical protein